MKDALQNELHCGQQHAIELLYTRYSEMLYGYVLQFIPDKLEGADLLVTIFSRLAPRLQEACDSHLSIYSWLQAEARKIILENQNEYTALPEPQRFTPSSWQNMTHYFSLLENASPEHQWVFGRLFLHGMQKQELASQAGEDLAYIDRLLRESLIIIRKRLG